MYTTSLNVSNYQDRNYNVRINAAWITVTDSKTGQVLAQRAADVVPHGWPDNWYDERHKAVIDALYKLQDAIFAMVDADNEKPLTSAG